MAIFYKYIYSNTCVTRITLSYSLLRVWLFHYHLLKIIVNNTRAELANSESRNLRSCRLLLRRPVRFCWTGLLMVWSPYILLRYSSFSEQPLGVFLCYFTRAVFLWTYVGHAHMFLGVWGQSPLLGTVKYWASTAAVRLHNLCLYSFFTQQKILLAHLWQKSDEVNLKVNPTVKLYRELHFKKLI